MNNHPLRLKNLSEAIIVQSVEDLWSPTHKKDSTDFFMGEGFRLASEMAGMSAVDRLRLLLMLRRCGQKVWSPIVLKNTTGSARILLNIYREMI